MSNRLLIYTEISFDYKMHEEEQIGIRSPREERPCCDRNIAGAGGEARQPKLKLGPKLLPEVLRDFGDGAGTGLK